MNIFRHQQLKDNTFSFHIQNCKIDDCIDMKSGYSVEIIAELNSGEVRVKLICIVDDVMVAPEDVDEKLLLDIIENITQYSLSNHLSEKKLVA